MSSQSLSAVQLPHLSAVDGSAASGLAAVHASITDGRPVLQLAQDLSSRHAKVAPQLPLKGRNVALILDEDDTSSNMFCQAAAHLGARVARIRPSLREDSDPAEIQHTARLLGRLYSALEWPHLSRSLQEKLKKELSIPVYAGISLPTHPLMLWAQHLDIDASPEDKWRLVIQAILLRDLG